MYGGETIFSRSLLIVIAQHSCTVLFVLASTSFCVKENDIKYGQKVTSRDPEDIESPWVVGLQL